MRRDCEPHRGELLAALGTLSFTVSMLSCFCCLPAVLSVPLGLTVWLLARHDLRQMDRSIVDPSGREMTRTARLDAMTAVFFGALPLLLVGALLYGYLAAR